MKKSLAWIFISVLLLFVVVFFLFVNSISKPKISQKAEEEVTTLDYKKLEKLEKLKHPGEPINIDEPGFGREDPFVPY